MKRNLAGCPPSGTHRYLFKLYALDIMPKLEPGATKADIEKLIRGHTLDQAQLIGTYKRLNGVDIRLLLHK